MHTDEIPVHDEQLPEPGMERLEALTNNIAAAPGNDAEIDALRTLLDAAFSILSFEQREAFFAVPEVLVFEQQAAKWADAQEVADHETPGSSFTLLEPQPTPQT